MAYSDTEKAEAVILLAVNKYDYDKTAEALGISAKTLRRWDKIVPKKGVAELLERAIERMLMHIPADMKGRDWAIALGILMDKWLLGQGMATSRSENIMGFLADMAPEEREKIIIEAERILSARASGSSNISDQ